MVVAQETGSTQRRDRSQGTALSLSQGVDDESTLSRPLTPSAGPSTLPCLCSSLSSPSLSAHALAHAADSPPTGRVGAGEPTRATSAPWLLRLDGSFQPLHSFLRPLPHPPHPPPRFQKDRHGRKYTHHSHRHEHHIHGGLYPGERITPLPLLHRIMHSRGG